MLSGAAGDRGSNEAPVSMHFEWLVWSRGWKRFWKLPRRHRSLWREWRDDGLSARKSGFVYSCPFFSQPEKISVDGCRSCIDWTTLRNHKLPAMSLYEHTLPASLIIVAGSYIFCVCSKRLCLRVPNHGSESDWVSAQVSLPLSVVIISILYWAVVNWPPSLQFTWTSQQRGMNEWTIALSLQTPPVGVFLEPTITQSRTYYQLVSDAANAMLQEL